MNILFIGGKTNSPPFLYPARFQSGIHRLINFDLLIPNIYDVSEENELEVLRAINNVNNSMKVAKLVISNDSVWVCFENLLDKEHKMEDLVPVAVSTLYQARQRFYAALKEE